MALSKITAPDKSVNGQLTSSEFNQLKASVNGNVDLIQPVLDTVNNPTNQFVTPAEKAALSLAQTNSLAGAEANIGLYYPLFKQLNAANATGLAIHSNGGIVAAVSGTLGSGSYYLPKPIDPSKPFRFAILVAINDNQGAYFEVRDEEGNENTGFGAGMGTGGLGITGNGNVTIINGLGNGAGIPSGTLQWFTLASSGDGLITIATMPFGNIGTQSYNEPPGFGTAYSNTAYGISVPSNTAAGGIAVWGGDGVQEKRRLCRVIVKNASTQNRVIGFYFAQSLNGPRDGQLQPPFMMQMKVDQDVTGWVTCPGKQGYLPVDLAMYTHPNASDQYSKTQNFPELNAAYNAGYLQFGILGSVNSGGYTDATASNWGASTGMKYRKDQLDIIRKMIPLTRNLYILGQSMGCMNALTFALEHPGTVKAIYAISGVCDIADSFNARGFDNIIKKAYGTWYVNIQAGTGQNPTTATTYWKKLTYGKGQPLAEYYQPPYTWKDQYDNGTAYALNDIIVVPDTSLTASGLAYFDPALNGSVYKFIPIRIVQGSADTLIPPSQGVTFKTAVEAAGGSVTLISVSGAGHLDPALYATGRGADIVAFFQANQ